MNNLVSKFVENKEQIKNFNNEIEEINLMEIELKNKKIELKKSIKTNENENRTISKLVTDQCTITGEEIPNELKETESESKNIEAGIFSED